MGITSVDRRPGTRRGPVWNENGSYTYSQQYVVKTNNPNNDGRSVIIAQGLPKVGTTFPGDASAYVSQIDPQQQEEDSVWYVTVTWTHPAPNQQQGTPPVGEPSALPQRAWTSVMYPTYPKGDLDGKSFRNAAGDPFDNPSVAVMKVNQVLTITIPGVESFNATQAHEYLNAINSDVVKVDGKTFPIFSGRITTFDGTLSYKADETPVWNVTVQIEFDRDLWKPLKVLNKGPQYLDAQTGEPVLARDANEVLRNSDILLMADGKKFPKGDLRAFWIFFSVYERKSFGALNLPLG